MIHPEARLHEYQAVIQGTQLKKRSFMTQRTSPSGYLFILQIHRDHKCEEKIIFSGVFQSQIFSGYKWVE